MKAVAAAFKFLVNLIELYIPIAAFITLFLSFLLQIFCRKFLRPLIWPEELSLICFIWIALLGSLYAKRTHSHVVFSMVYDALTALGQRRMRLIGNFIMLIALSIAIYPSWSYVSFMVYKKSDALHIPMNVVYFPFVIFLFGMIVRILLDIIYDMKMLCRARE